MLTRHGEGARSTGPAVLLVDEDLAVCRSVAAGLGRAGFQVLSATDTLHALDQLGRIRVDAVIADLRLGEVSGIDILVETARFQPTARRILVSGDNATKLAQLRARGEFDAYLRKPFSITELTGALAALGIRASRDRGRRPDTRPLGIDSVES